MTPTLVNGVVEESAGPVSQRLEAALRRAADTLRTAYPRLDMLGIGNLTTKTLSDGTFAKGTVGGAALAATGVGFAAAGAAQAAAIAAANAVALAATSTVAAPTLAGTWLAALGGGTWLAPLLTGTATVSTPVAITTAPLWVALSGPVGWTLALVGACAVPLAWRTSKLNAKGQLEEACRTHLNQLFASLRGDRVGALRQMAPSIVQEFQLRLDRQLSDVERVLSDAKAPRTGTVDVAALQHTASALRDVLEQADKLGTASQPQ